MNLIDLTIIYLTCGAPFGVYYFYQQREYFNSLKLWASSIFITLLWIPYAITFLLKAVTKKLRNNQFAEKTFSDSSIEDFERKFTQLLLEEKIDISLFDFRETFERYVGLTKGLFVESTESESELFQLSNHENKKLATKILSRHNRSRLQAHQILAREDFLRFVIEIDSNLFEKEKVRTLAMDFVKLINDIEARNKLDNYFQNPTQSDHGFTVNEMEKEVWNPIETKQLPTPAKALNFRTLSATATISKRD